MIENIRNERDRQNLADAIELERLGLNRTVATANDLVAANKALSEIVVSLTEITAAMDGVLADVEAVRKLLSARLDAIARKVQ